MKATAIFLFCALSLLIVGDADDRKFWFDKAAQKLRENLKLKPVLKKAKNVAFFLGDGMGLSTLAAARILNYELGGSKLPYFPPLAFEKWPHAGLSMTHSTDAQVTDSAAAATAFLAGVKTGSGLLAVDSSVTFNNCSTYDKSKELQSFLTMALAQKKAVGLVTTTRVTHATPAAAYAHAASRNWESDTDRNAHVPAHLRSRCPDIASQLVANAIDFRVIMGGGRRAFLTKARNGSRTEVDLIARWKAEQKAKGRRYSYIESGRELRSLETGKTDYVLGLFADSHMDYEYERREKGGVQPSLEEMTAKAVQILQRDSNGFVLFVEGGRIDHAHHAGIAHLALQDTLALNSAVDKVEKLVQLNDTLLVVTADHSHVFTVGGYPSLHNPILGVSDYDNGSGKGRGKDGKLFTTLLYANGPGAAINESRSQVDRTKALDPKYRQQALVPLSSESHAGEDVGIYARGPMAHLFQGVVDQNYIAHVVMYNQCLGTYLEGNHCKVSSSARGRPSWSLVAWISLMLSVRLFL